MEGHKRDSGYTPVVHFSVAVTVYSEESSLERKASVWLTLSSHSPSSETGQELKQEIKVQPRGKAWWLAFSGVDPSS